MTKHRYHEYLSEILSAVTNKENKRDLANKIPKGLYFEAPDGKVHNVRELLTTTDLRDSGLVETAIYDQILESSEMTRVMRDAMPSYAIQASSERIPVRKLGDYASYVDEDAENPQTEYVYMQLDAKKIAVTIGITAEMIANYQWGVIAEEMKRAGKMLENTINRDALSVLLDGVDQVADTNGSGQGKLAIFQAITKIKDAGYIPDTMVMCPQFEGTIIDELIAPYQVSARTSQYPLDGQIPKVMGLNIYLNNTCPHCEDKWSYNEAGDVGAIVYSKYHIGGIGVHEDISIESFDDPILDMVGMKCTGRFSYGVVRENKQCACKVVF
jgi:hypothetical protein